MRTALLLFALAITVALVAASEEQLDKESLRTTLEALLPDADVQEKDGRLQTAPLKAKLFQLKRKLELELADLLQQKDDMANGIAKAKFRLDQAQKVFDASEDTMRRTAPEKTAADLEVVRIKSTLEVTIRKVKRTLEFNNLERKALYTQIKFSEFGLTIRNRVVGKASAVSMISVDDLEASAQDQELSLLVENKETKMSMQIKTDFEAFIKECEDRLDKLKDWDKENDFSVKKLQAELTIAIERQKKLADDYKDSQKAFKDAGLALSKFTGMYEEMLKIGKRDGDALNDKIIVIKKELALLAAMVTKIDNYRG